MDSMKKPRQKVILKWKGGGNVLYVGNVEEFAPLRATTVLVGEEFK